MAIHHSWTLQLTLQEKKGSVKQSKRVAPLINLLWEHKANLKANIQSHPVISTTLNIWYSNHNIYTHCPKHILAYCITFTLLDYPQSMEKEDFIKFINSSKTTENASYQHIKLGGKAN